MAKKINDRIERLEEELEEAREMRAKEIYELKKSTTLTWEEIGKLYDVTRQYAWQMANDWEESHAT